VLPAENFKLHFSSCLYISAVNKVRRRLTNTETQVQNSTFSSRFNPRKPSDVL
jgi:hypothetical protein